ncbi:MAG: GNAT family N-acetyltransferase [Candidatus Bipolaricaulis sp.]|nr:GNAT family N-acetyltransferase [Candidatus Bipolaricaulis sp.]
MNLDMRTYRDDNDIWRIREFLREVYLANDRREHSWHVARFDYWRWHTVANCGQTLDNLFLWETRGGEIAALLTTEGGGDGFLNVHPEARTASLEDEMVSVAEKHLAVPCTGGPSLVIPAREGDALREGVLAARGYKRLEHCEDQRRLDLTGQLPEGPVPAGYVVRALGGPEELPARSWASWRSFHPDDPDEAYEGWDWYLNIQRAPLYRRDLDIVAIAPNGDVAAFCTMWYDDVTRSGYFAPVGTAPEHQGRGLGKAVMAEAVRRLAAMGAVTMHIGGYDPIPKRLYASIGGPDLVRSISWHRYLPEG